MYATLSHRIPQAILEDAAFVRQDRSSVTGKASEMAAIIACKLEGGTKVRQLLLKAEPLGKYRHKVAL